MTDDSISTSERRSFLIAAGVALATGSGAASAQQKAPATTPAAPSVPAFKHMSRPTLPYSSGALAPIISVETIDYHYGKHHIGYWDRMLPLVVRRGWQDLTLEEVVRRSHAANDVELFQLAAQVYNHNVFWASLRAPKEGVNEIADDHLNRRVLKHFGSFAGLKQRLIDASTAHFGSGWVWLVARQDGSLEVMETDNADNPLTAGVRPLLTIDVWEHAYYIDWRNARGKYVQKLVENLISWDSVADRYRG